MAAIRSGDSQSLTAITPWALPRCLALRANGSVRFCRWRIRSALGQRLERLADPVRHAQTFGQLLERIERLFLVVPEREQRIENVPGCPGGAGHRGARGEFGAELVLQLEQQPL